MHGSNLRQRAVAAGMVKPIYSGAHYVKVPDASFVCPRQATGNVQGTLEQPAQIDTSTDCSISESCTVGVMSIIHKPMVTNCSEANQMQQHLSCCYARCMCCTQLGN